MAIKRTELGQRVGHRLRFHRDEAGLTTAALAVRAGVSEVTVQRHLRGDNLPDVGTLLAYAAALDCLPSQLLPPWAPWDSNPQPTDSVLVGAA